MPKLSLERELADIRAEIARLKRREDTLLSLDRTALFVPVFRRGWAVGHATSALEHA